MKIILLTGLTCSGKTNIIKNISKSQSLKINLICGDILQSYKNFPILSNNSFDEKNQSSLKSHDFFFHNIKFQLYKTHDLFTDKFNAFEYGNKIKNKLDSDCLNIIEGGCGFYLYFLRTKILQEYDPKSIVLYYDHNQNINNIIQRSEEMFNKGCINEVIQFTNQCKLLKIEPPKLLPIGFEQITDLIGKLDEIDSKSEKKKWQQKSLEYFDRCFYLFVEKQKKYSTTQLKYMKKYFTGDGIYSIDIFKDKDLLNGNNLTELMRNQTHKEFDVSNFQRLYTQTFCRKLSEKMRGNMKKEQKLKLLENLKSMIERTNKETET